MSFMSRAEVAALCQLAKKPIMQLRVQCRLVRDNGEAERSERQEEALQSTTSSQPMADPHAPAECEDVAADLRQHDERIRRAG
jgi:small-conductance mechanosensitive channel